MLELILLPPLLTSMAVTLYYKEVMTDVMTAGVLLVWLLVLIELMGPGVIDNFTYWFTVTLIQMSSTLYFMT
jgi:hypothetical protein